MELNYKKICDEYLGGKGIENLAKENHVGKIKIKKILEDNKIEIHCRGGQKISREYIINDYHIKKYMPKDGYHYIAVAIDNSITFDDYMNDGGHLTGYINTKYGIDVPSLYDRRIYYQTTGNYWWEQWFNIIMVKDKPVKKCPYCDWTTEDVENKSGMFMTHLLKEHSITIDRYLNEYPEDKQYFSKQNSIIEKVEKLNDIKNYVICPICGEKLEKITYWHIKHKHNMEYNEFRIKYPKCKILSDNMLEQTLSTQKLVNLTVSKNRFISKYEKEIQKLLDSFDIKYDTNRQILIGKEIDILIDDKKIGIEFNGVKWHTEWFGGKDRNYHLNKTIKCNEKGYGLIHIFEDEYVNHKTLVQNKILHLLGCQKDSIKVGARKCVIKDIKKYDAEVFLNKYHIQGFASSTIYLGAFYENRLVAVMSFKNGNLRNPYWELTRFASDYNYTCQGVGGKLFKYFIRKYNPNKVISFADRRWTINITNNLYIKLGFNLEKINQPDYKYYNEKIDRYKRVHKMYFNKQKLHKKYGFPLTMTETEMAKELGYDRIWDCGLIKYVWTADWLKKE